VIAVYELYQTDTFISDLKSLDRKTKDTVKRIVYKLVEDPTRYKPLKGKSGYFRIRLGSYRLVYKIKNKKITLMFIRKRDRVYKKL